MTQQKERPLRVIDGKYIIINGKKYDIKKLPPAMINKLKIYTLYTKEKRKPVAPKKKIDKEVLRRYLKLPKNARLPRERRQTTNKKYDESIKLLEEQIRELNEAKKKTESEKQKNDIILEKEKLNLAIKELEIHKKNKTPPVINPKLIPKNLRKFLNKEWVEKKYKVIGDDGHEKNVNLLILKDNIDDLKKVDEQVKLLFDENNKLTNERIALINERDFLLDKITDERRELENIEKAISEGAEKIKRQNSQSFGDLERMKSESETRDEIERRLEKYKNLYKKKKEEHLKALNRINELDHEIGEWKFTVEQKSMEKSQIKHDMSDLKKQHGKEKEELKHDMSNLKRQHAKEKEELKDDLNNLLLQLNEQSIDEGYVPILDEIEDKPFGEVINHMNGNGMIEKGGLNSDQINLMLGNLPGYKGVFSYDTLHHLKIDYPIFSFVLLIKDYEGGESNHFVGLFCDFVRKEMCYYDSYGKPADEKLKQFLHNMFKKIKLPFVLKWKYNLVKNQGVNTDTCGLYVSRWLTLMTYAIPFKESTDFKDIMDNEEDMETVRDRFGFI